MHDHVLDLRLLCSLLRNYYLPPYFLLQAFPRDVKVNIKPSKIKPIHAELLVKLKVYTDMQARGSLIKKVSRKLESLML